MILHIWSLFWHVLGWCKTVKTNNGEKRKVMIDDGKNEMNMIENEERWWQKRKICAHEQNKIRDNIERRYVTSEMYDNSEKKEETNMIDYREW